MRQSPISTGAIFLTSGEREESLVVDDLGKERSLIGSAKRLPGRLRRSIRKRTLDKAPLTVRWFANSHLYGRKLRLVSASQFSASGEVQRILVSEGQETPISEPAFIGHQPVIDHSPRHLIEPEISIFEYNDAIALAGTDFVLKGRDCIHPDLFNPARDFPMAENFREIRILPKRNFMVHASFEPPARMKEAISLLGQCAGSYAHFMSEVLPKLMIIDGRPEYDGIPLLIDAWIPPPLVQIIERFNLKRRRIYRVVIRRPVQAERLITVSPTSYTPPELRAVMENRPKPRLPADTHKFSSYALSLVREAGRAISPKPASWIGEKLYLRRSASMNGRGIVNDANIELFAQREGFDIIDPATLTIDEQIAVFQKAKVIMAPVGGSLVNTMFAEPGCKIICLSAFFKDGEYDYHAQMQKAFGHDLRFVVGPQLPNQTGHIMHRDYRIAMNDVAEAIRIMC